MLRLQLALLALFISGTDASPAAQVPHVLLHSLFDPGTNAQVSARQGQSVAVGANLVAVGAPSTTLGIRQEGVVKVYEASCGALVYTLTNPHPSAGEAFGWAVAISGTRLVVGANWDKGGTNLTGNAIGCAYVYELAGATPTLPVLTLTNPNPSPGLNLFAHSVAISGLLVVVGGPGDDRDGVDAGVAYVYDLASAAPDAPLFVLRNPSPATNEGFGVTVAISGTRAVVGTPWDGTGAIFAGSAYVFDLDGLTPTIPEHTLNNPYLAANDQFGYAVAVDGNSVVVGANQDDTSMTDAGTAYIYDLASATPTSPTITLTSPSSAISDNFGWSVAISGTRVVVGAIYADTGATNAGNAYVYDLAGATPTIPVRVLNNPTPAVNDNFAHAVAITCTRVVVGAPNDDLGATDSGGAYVYELTGATPGVPTAVLAQPSLAYGDFFVSVIQPAWVDGRRAS